jgi:hypothetical protein
VIERVAKAVRALPEPFRAFVLLRFWRGLGPAAIALELGVPRNTVRSRLQRGLAHLRAQLDAAYGDRTAWSAPLGLGVGWGQLSGGIVAKKVSAGLIGIALLGVVGWQVSAHVVASGTDAPVVAVGPPSSIEGEAARATQSASAERSRVPAPTACVVVDAVTGVGLAVELEVQRVARNTGMVDADRSIRSDATGAFTLPGDLVPGPYELRSARGPRVVGGGAFTIEADRPRPALRVLVAASRSDQLTGVARDAADGRPLADVVIWAKQPDGALFTTYTDADGRFELWADDLRSGAVALSIDRRWRDRPRGGFEYQLRERPVHAWWGARDVELLLCRAPALVVRVRDEHGSAVSRFATACVALGGNGGGGFPMRVGEQANGEQILHYVADDQPYALLVVPGSPDLFAAAPQRVSRRNGSPEVVTVCLQRRRDVVVRCSDARGRTLAGVRIDVLADVPYVPRNPGLPALPIADLADVSCATLGYASALSGEDGRATLRLPADLRGYRWRLTGAGAVFYEHAGELLSRSIEFTIPDGGLLVVRAPGAATESGISLLSASVSPDASPLRLPIVSEPDWAFDVMGTATVTGIPVGDWHVELGRYGEPERIGTIRVRAGSMHELTVSR